ncbi:MAG: UPF0182 family protein [Actinobacteria bacterium]|nr:UPF0182 family protein [Actinomycetota bacterium]
MPDTQSLKRQAILIAILALLFVLADAAMGAVGFYTDWLWFGSLGFQSVFMTVFQAKAVAFLAGVVAFFLPAVASVLLALVIMRKHHTVSIREESGVAYIVQLGQDVPRRWVTVIAMVAALGLSVIMGMSASGQWETALKYLNGRAFGATDPLFNQDVAFYIFTLPFIGFVQGWVLWALVLILAITAAVYLISIYEGNIGIDPGVFTAHRAAKVHVMVLGALVALALAASYRLQIFDLVYASNSITAGAGFTDATARQTAYWAMMGILVITAALFLASIFRRGFALPLWGVGLWLVAAIVLGGVYPALVQKFQVEPSQLEKEQPYIQNSIKMTRQAFGLDSIQEQDFNAGDAVTPDEINSNLDTVNNIRLWDYRPLMDTYNQIQAIRLYYDFNNVGVDRYTIDGQYRQVMLSARELSPDKLASQAQTWQTRHLQFTHGYGLAMSPVNEVVGEGLPNLLVKDLPPQGSLKIDRPEIYYGQKTSDYVMVNTGAQEFDYAKGDENVYGTYQGEGGVKLDSFLKKLAYAWYFRDGNILFTQYLTPDSRVLYVRPIQDRIKKIAPFLMLDRDPYLVVADGQLFWIQDAYTYSNDYPYSALYQERRTVTNAAQRAGQPATQQVATGRQFNYIRNSVKAVISAYDGSVHFYLADPKDPLAAAYGSIFPGLFTPMDQMPASLKAHVRYPEDLFSAQAEMFRAYHMQDARTFYNREDMWSVPVEMQGNSRQPVEPYYLIMKLPGQPKEEFLQLLPFSPSNKDNMIAWMAARSDGANYGKLIVYKYPKDKLVYGPVQVDARVNQDPTISAQFTLWGQRGSQVTRGNLLVIPVGQANLYVAPVYLQADQASIPELKRVIASTGNKVVMEATLGEALNKLFDGKVSLGPSGRPAPAAAQTVAQPGQPAQPAQGGQAAPAVAQPGVPAAPAASASLADLIKSAQDHYNQAQDRLKAGDWAGYGDQMKKLEEDLKVLGTRQ